MYCYMTKESEQRNENKLQTYRKKKAGKNKTEGEQILTQAKEKKKEGREKLTKSKKIKQINYKQIKKQKSE